MKCHFISVIILLMECTAIKGIFLIVPEDIPQGFAAIYGFSPRLKAGRDNRFGFGFRFGNHADLQILYELGPQTLTKPLQPVRVRSASYRERVTRRRPLLELLLRAGILHQAEYAVDLDFDQPR